MYYVDYCSGRKTVVFVGKMRDWNFQPKKICYRTKHYITLKLMWSTIRIFNQPSQWQFCTIVYRLMWNILKACSIWTCAWPPSSVLYLKYHHKLCRRNSIKLTDLDRHAEQEIGAIIQTSVFCVDKTCFPRPGHHMLCSKLLLFP